MELYDSKLNKLSGVPGGITRNLTYRVEYRTGKIIEKGQYEKMSKTEKTTKNSRIYSIPLNSTHKINLMRCLKLYFVMSGIMLMITNITSDHFDLI